jgi:hypothetical protein
MNDAHIPERPDQSNARLAMFECLLFDWGDSESRRAATNGPLVLVIALESNTQAELDLPWRTE